MFNFSGGSSSERPASLLDTAKGLFEALLVKLDTRLALLSNEIEEERLRVSEMIVFAMAGFFCLIFGLMLLSLLVIALTWETAWRYWVFSGVTGAYFIGAYLFWSRLKQRIAEKPKIFSTTRAELKKDIERLRS